MNGIQNLEIKGMHYILAVTRFKDWKAITGRSFLKREIASSSFVYQECLAPTK